MERLSSPAAERNKDPITDVLRDELPQQGIVLEIASGSGQHVVHFARAFPHLQWQPSDPSEEARASITVRINESGCDNILPPLAIDCASSDWPAIIPDAILCINMVHISSWEATVGLLSWSGINLAMSHPLLLYGPFWREGYPREPSNVDFDHSLRRQNPQWGIRKLADVEKQAAQLALQLDRVVPMPANNLMAIFRASRQDIP